MTTRIDVLRHGEPEGGRRYRGHGVDDPLTETGWQQMWHAVPEVAPWSYILSSPLQRCLTFSRALSEKHNIEYGVDERLKEIGFGDWEGKTPDEIIAADPMALDHFYADPVNNRPAGAESLQGFSERVWQAYETIHEARGGEHILIVAHAGVARAIAANILGMSLDDVYSRLRITYAGILSTQVEKGKPPKVLIESR